MIQREVIITSSHGVQLEDGTLGEDHIHRFHMMDISYFYKSGIEVSKSPEMKTLGWLQSDAIHIESKSNRGRYEGLFYLGNMLTLCTAFLFKIRGLKMAAILLMITPPHGVQLEDGILGEDHIHRFHMMDISYFYKSGIEVSTDSIWWIYPTSTRVA